MTVFIAGGTGYMGRALIPQLLERGHAVAGDALDSRTLAAHVKGADTWVHLVGVPRPSPWKGDQFRAVDLASVRAAVEAAGPAGIRHFVYLSVAQPAPIMRDYIAVRAEGERLIRAAGLPATFIRPWYVVGPGHRWPLLLRPFYALAELLPATRDTARRLGLVTIEQITATLVEAVERPADGVRVVEVEQITRAPGSR